jgi:hypothetical protein
MSDNNIISIGDDFRKYDRRLWGWRDRARAAKEDQQTNLTDTWILGGAKPLAPDHVMSLAATRPDDGGRSAPTRGARPSARGAARSSPAERVVKDRPGRSGVSCPGPTRPMAREK